MFFHTAPNDRSDITSNFLNVMLPGSNERRVCLLIARGRFRIFITLLYRGVQVLLPSVNADRPPHVHYTVGLLFTLFT